MSNLVGWLVIFLYKCEPGRGEVEDEVLTLICVLVVVHHHDCLASKTFSELEKITCPTGLSCSTEAHYFTTPRFQGIFMILSNLGKQILQLENLFRIRNKTKKHFSLRLKRVGVKMFTLYFSDIIMHFRALDNIRLLSL